MAMALPPPRWGVLALVVASEITVEFTFMPKWASWAWAPVFRNDIIIRVS